MVATPYSRKVHCVRIAAAALLPLKLIVAENSISNLVVIYNYNFKCELRLIVSLCYSRRLTDSGAKVLPELTLTGGLRFVPW